MANLRILGLFCGIVVILSCAAKKPYFKDQSTTQDQAGIEESNIDYELFLVGDIGANSTDISDSDIVDLIKSELVVNDVEKSVVFLGNSFGEQGFPDEESSEFQSLNAFTTKCINTLKDHTDKVFFIPGNNEWFDGQDYTVSAVHQVEEYVQGKVGGKNIFVPSNGCGEPKLVNLTDDLMLLLIDSQWILQGDRSDERTRSGCEIDNELDLVAYIEEKLSKNKNKNVIIAAHHPIYSNGLTGGNARPVSHIIPLPILGSVINGVKKISGGQQKFGHPQYETYRATMELALKNFEGVIHASAHDRNMQYHHQHDNHYVVAGSGSDVDFVRKGGTADFAWMQKGFSRITHTKDLELWLEFYVPDENNPKKAKSVFKKLLYKKEIIDYSDKTVYRDLADYPKEQKTQASSIYAKGKVGLGKTYRDEWGTEVEVPVLLLEETHGGLLPVQQGGGFQTKSIRLENAEGRQWVLRTVDKDVTKVVPPALRKTFVKNVVQDGISAAHPYAAIAVPKLAEAAQIYHANPKIVWVPKQKPLGDFNTVYGDRLYLFEERPGGNMDGHPTYGGAKESINTNELVEKLLKNHKHEVDQEYVLRARLFDLMIGDWDRHDDQWRWGVFDGDDGKKLYRAIPRDRDQAFFKNDGFLNYIASRPYFGPQLRKFNDEIENISGLAYNARHFDRHFLSQLNEEDFVAAAKELQANVTDEVIRTAFSDWPKEIYDLSGDEIVAKVKNRRDNLEGYARQFYEFLTKEVTVIGTNKKNTFDINTLPGDKLDVKVYHEDKDQKHLIWSRVIDGSDCEELRLFGLKKSDTFNFSGTAPSSVKVRLVGGSGDDNLYNNSAGKNIEILAYDRPDGMSLSGTDVTSKLKDEDGINSFDRKDWELDRSIHFPLPTFYTDEGIGLSYNVWWTRHGFRKDPYQSNHILSLGYFFANSAFVGNYSGHWASAFGPDWDFQLDASFIGFAFNQWFYGLGNEYINYEEVFPEIEISGDIEFHIVRGNHLDINPHFVKDLGNNRTFSINPSFEYRNFSDDLQDPDEERFIFTDEAQRTAEDFETKFYTGIGLKYTSNRVNNPLIPTRGYLFDIGADFKQSLSGESFSNLTVSSSVSAYIPFSPTHKVVFATHLGGAYTFGDYEFFHANYLSSQSRLRGFRTNRFAGDGILYHASDLRINLFHGRGGIRTGLGIFGSFDYGRAFLEGEGINTWHTAVGGGIYLTPLDILGFKIGYYVGEDDTQISVGGALSF